MLISFVFDSPKRFERLESLDDLIKFALLVPQRNPHSKLPVFKIAQRLVDLVVAVRFCNETFEFDPAGRCHLKHLLDIKGLPARDPRNGNLAGDETAAADDERAVA